MYLGSAMGDVSATDFVSRSGVCKPTNFETLTKFKALQKQLNRAATGAGLQTIAVDGDIGPGTVKLLALVQGGAQMSCSAIAIAAEGLTPQLKSIADQAGVPASVSSPKPAAPLPAVVNATTGVLTPQPATASVLDAFNRLSSTEKLLAVAVIGGGAYVLLGKKKRRGR